MNIFRARVLQSVSFVLLVVVGLLPTAAPQAQGFRYDVDSSADGSRIVVLDGDIFRTYDAELNLLASREVVSELIFRFWVSPGGERVIVQGPIWEIWDTATLQTIQTLPIDRWVQYIEWRADGLEIAVTYELEPGIFFIDAATGAITRQFDDSQTQLWRVPKPRAWSPDGTTFAQVWGAGYERLSLLDAQTGLERIMYTVDGSISDVNWSFDSRFVALSVYRPVDPPVSGNRLVSDLVILDVLDGTQVRTAQNFPGFLGTVAWSRFQSQITLVSRGQISFIDPTTGDVINAFSGGGYITYTPFEGRLNIAYSTINIEPSTLAARETAVEIIDTVTGTHGNIITIVPHPSIERLNAIAAACDAPVAPTTDMADFIAQVEALPADSIPPACAADLLAVARALEGG
ncbi:MAG: hypothetical protein KME04_11750 [Pleurocapsa minor GSE-CHR-MK-17-07R]|nr:hypothetical protein [Pleurocapsa minor GSE-CHR-MK 17-07R]